MYFAFDETDNFAHKGEYGAYLNSAHNIDQFIMELWEYLQSDAFYKGSTTIIITTDHGRGTDDNTWKDHGINTVGSDQIWIAFLGPDTPSLGELKTPGQLYQNQIAKTLTAFLDIDFQGNLHPGEMIKEAMNKQ
jgi:predicted AlkP superfamily pyrophosphatase or phosphodiesterase